MLTHHRHRYLTRWPRRLAFALAIVLQLAAAWRSWASHAPRALGTIETSCA